MLLSGLFKRTLNHKNSSKIGPKTKWQMERYKDPNYEAKKFMSIWGDVPDLNRQPSAPQADALTS